MNVIVRYLDHAAHNGLITVSSQTSTLANEGVVPAVDLDSRDVIGRPRPLVHLRAKETEVLRKPANLQTEPKFAEEYVTEEEGLDGSSNEGYRCRTRHLNGLCLEGVS